MRTRWLLRARPPGLLLAALALTALPAVASSPRNAVAAGVITGRVTDESGRPLVWANVVLVGTRWGTSSSADGTYTIPEIPAGAYTVKVTMQGYEEQEIEGVLVGPASRPDLDFHLRQKPVDTLPVVIITASRASLEKTPETRYTINPEEVKELPFDNLQQVLALTPGVVARAGELHFRGGRAGEVLSQIDGVPVRDPLGGSSADLAMLAVQSTEQILGGLDARYGNAQSGVINYKTKEGTDRFEGEIYYLTDDYGQPGNTFDNLDKLFVGLGGPMPVRHLTYYVSGEATYSDDYPRTIRRRAHHRLLNLISLGSRKTDQLRFQGKLAFRPRPDSKLTLEHLANRSRREIYYHVWSRDGWVQTFQDTTRTGEVALRHGRWSETRLDSTYQYYNAAEHTPDYDDRVTQTKLVWNRSLDKDSYYTIKLNRGHFVSDSRVAGKQAWEYQGDDRDLFFDYADRTSSEFFAVSGDYPQLQGRETIVYLAKADLTRRAREHTIQTGLEATYNDMRYLQVDRPSQTNPLGEIGIRTRYHSYNPEGALYLQDRWEHEGMILNLGGRYDIFSVGRQVDVSEVRQPVKTQFSPRIGIAYPISDTDVFSFHYGRFYQTPDRQYIFDNREVYDGRIRGNPNLVNETTVSYQAGIQHLFSDIISAQFSVYYKDIFGLIDTEELPSLGSVGNLISYINKDYASARGFELSLSRRFRNSFSGEIHYGFGVATGVASDPNAAASQTFAYLPIAEQPLDWDSRHTVSVQFVLAEPSVWSTSFVWQYESGFPYTPRSRNTRELKPEVINSRRLPSTTTLDVQAEKHYKLWEQSFKIFLQGRNVLDARNITVLSPANWPLAPGRDPFDYDVYFTETGKAGGGYVGADRNGDGVGDWVPLEDPRVYGNPRSVRMGMTYSF
jgi:outer membrane receptor for ferrienterochelin and colicin